MTKRKSWRDVLPVHPADAQRHDHRHAWRRDADVRPVGAPPVGLPVLPAVQVPTVSQAIQRAALHQVRP